MTSLMGIARRITGTASFVSALVLLGSATPVVAQDVSADPRWQAWLGCWEVVESESLAIGSTQKPRVCVIPTADASAIEIVTVVADSIALRQRIAATGEQRQTSKDGCAGWEKAQWSQNGQRVYLRSSYSCPGGLTRSSNGIMAVSSTGEWLDVQGVVAGTTVGVRVARYRDVTDVSDLPTEIATALTGRAPVVNDARIAAMAPLTTEDVVEASRFIDPGVIQTWLAERGEGFALDANRLIELEKSGVAPLVIDVMVALSYPNVFALDRSRVTGATRDSADGYVGSGRTVTLYGWDPFYSPYGYGYGYRSGYGYGGYGGGWYYGNRPVVIVRQPSSDAEAERHGRVIKGRGYVPGRRSGGRTGSAASGSSDRSGSTGSAASGSTGGSSSKPASTGSGRTAKPRPPK